MKVTVRDIAKKAGVSATSVSLVLNNKPQRISEETKDRILNAAKELGYKKKAYQTVRTSNNKKVIGVIHPDLNNLFLNQCVGGIEQYASVYGYKLLICDTEDTTARSLEYLELLTGLGVDGVIVIPPMDMHVQEANTELVRFFKHSTIQFVLLDRAIKNVFCDFFTADNKQGAYLATEHLILNGHNDIGLITGNREVYNCRKQIAGYKEALAYYKFAINEDYIYYGDFHLKSGYAAAEYFLQKNIRAIFSSSDEMAMGVYQYAIDNGLVIGEDISIVGYDDVSTCERLTPPLTSIHQSGELMGKRACEMLIKRITKIETGVSQNMYFTPQLIERRSVKKIIR